MIFNVTSGSGGTGGTLTVNAPTYCAVTVTKGSKTQSKSSGSSGVATFKNMEAGTWTVTISDGYDTSTREVEISTNYSVTMSFFSATISVTYPSGSTLTCSDGSTTLKATSTTGSYTFTVPNSGTWTVKAVSGDKSASKTVTISTNGQSVSVELLYEYVFIPGTDFASATVSGETSRSSVTNDGDGTYTIKAANSFRAVFGIDVTKYNTMKIKGSRTGCQSHLAIGLFSNSGGSGTFTPTSDFVVGYKDSIYTAATIDGSYDLTSVTGTQYFGIQTSLGSEYLQNMTILLDSVIFE